MKIWMTHKMMTGTSAWIDLRRFTHPRRGVIQRLGHGRSSSTACVAVAGGLRGVLPELVPIARLRGGERPRPFKYEFLVEFCYLS